MGPMVPCRWEAPGEARTAHSLHTGGVTGSIPVAPTIDIILKSLSYQCHHNGAAICCAQDMAHEIPRLRIRPGSQNEPNGRDTRLTEWAGGSSAPASVDHLIWRN